MEGKSLVPIFKTGHREGHDYLGFEHYNERAFLSNDGWKLVRPGENAKWELYNLNEDRSEMHNLAAQYLSLIHIYPQQKVINFGINLNF